MVKRTKKTRISVDQAEELESLLGECLIVWQDSVTEMKRRVVSSAQGELKDTLRRMGALLLYKALSDQVRSINMDLVNLQEGGMDRYLIEEIAREVKSLDTFLTKHFHVVGDPRSKVRPYLWEVSF